MADEWYYVKDGQQQGPVSSEQLKELATSSQLQATDLVWKDGMDEWVAAGTLPELSPAKKPGPPSIPPVPKPDASIPAGVADNTSVQETEWWCHTGDRRLGMFFKGGQQYGPLAESVLRTWIQERRIAPTNYVLKVGMTDWRRLSDVPEFADCLPAPLPPPPQSPSQPSTAAVSPPTPSAAAAKVIGGFLGGLKKVSQSVRLPNTAQPVPTASAFQPVHTASTAQPEPTASPSQPVPIASPSQPVLFSNSGSLLDRAKASCAHGRYGWAEQLLKQLGTNGAEGQEVEAILKQIGTIAAVPASYAGGHPEHVESGDGLLRLDSLGAEFVPTSTGSSLYFRIPYVNLLDVLEVARGDFPAAFLQKLEGRKKTGGALKFAGNLAGGLLGGHAGKAASAVGNATGSHVAGSGQPTMKPENRIRLFSVFDGVKYKVAFDAVAETIEDMEELAKSFRRKAEMARGRFGKPVQKQSSPQAGANTSGDSTSVAAPPAVSSQPTTEQKKVVGCPKCSTKLRVGQAGTIQCPKCQTKIRVPTSLFEA